MRYNTTKSEITTKTVTLFLHQSTQTPMLCWLTSLFVIFTVI